MNLQSWLLFLHVLGAIVWMGSGATLSLIGLGVRRSSEPAVVAGFSGTLRYLGLRIFTPSLLVVLASGLLMVFLGSHWKIGQPWILIGLALFLVAFLIGAVYLSRVSIALERVVARPGGSAREAGALISRWIFGYGVILVLLVAAVWDMIFKPFG